MKTPFLILITFLFTLPISSQEAIFFKNPSFNGTPGYGHLADGWSNCAFNYETPPDLYPIKNGYFRVSQQPKHGKTFVGLVGRDYGRTESIGQELDQPLQAGECYEFSLWMSKSDSLYAIHRLTRKRTDFNQPLMLAIWGGLSPCGKKEQLAVSPIVDHADWKKYHFQIHPKAAFTHISFEAQYGGKLKDAYNGNLLLDFVSPIFPVDCETADYLIDTSLIEVPDFKYVVYEKPYNGNWGSLLFYQRKIKEGNHFRIAQSEAELNSIINKQCGSIGFKKNSAELLGEDVFGFLEIAFNIQSYKNIFLTVPIFAANEKLFKKRKKVVERIMAAANLSKERFVVEQFVEKDNLKCGGNGVWLTWRKLD